MLFSRCRTVTDTEAYGGRYLWESPASLWRDCYKMDCIIQLILNLVISKTELQISPFRRSGRGRRKRHLPECCVQAFNGTDINLFVAPVLPIDCDVERRDGYGEPCSL